jgi:hypothetical protein
MENLAKQWITLFINHYNELLPHLLNEIKIKSYILYKINEGKSENNSNTSNEWIKDINCIQDLNDIEKKLAINFNIEKYNLRHKTSWILIDLPQKLFEIIMPSFIEFANYINSNHKKDFINIYNPTFDLLDLEKLSIDATKNKIKTYVKDEYIDQFAKNLKALPQLITDHFINNPSEHKKLIYFNTIQNWLIPKEENNNPI